MYVFLNQMSPVLFAFSHLSISKEPSLHVNIVVYNK